MKKQAFLLNIILFTLILSSCKKEDDTPIYYPPNTNPNFYEYDSIINPVLIQNFIFGKESYWIYKDSLSGIIDSCYVDSTIVNYHISQEYSGDPEAGGVLTEYHNKYIYNSKVSNFPSFYLLYSDNNIQMDLTYREMIMSYVDDIVIAWYLNNTSFWLADEDTYYPSYSIDTTVYTDVYKLFYKNHWKTFSSVDSGYYYMKAGIGIIKNEYYINGQKSVYELMRYSIN
jgi:hypothetical protein